LRASRTSHYWPVGLFTNPAPLMRINDAVLQPGEMKRNGRRTVMNNVAVLDSTVQETHEWLKDSTDGLGFPN
jgi:hypothetical protein